MKNYVICINNDTNPASLIMGKVYLKIPDAAAEALHMIRVIDEDKSEPDGYLYPMSMFVSIELPEVAKQALRKTLSATRSMPKIKKSPANPTIRV